MASSTTMDTSQPPPDVDPEVWISLPEEIRAEILREANREASRAANAASSSTAHPRTAEPGNSEESAPSSSSQQGSNAPSGEVDISQFLATLPPDLRNQVLLTATHEEVARMPPELRAEVDRLRHQAAVEQGHRHEERARQDDGQPQTGRSRENEVDSSSGTGMPPYARITVDTLSSRAIPGSSPLRSYDDAVKLINLFLHDQHSPGTTSHRRALQDILTSLSLQKDSRDLILKALISACALGRKRPNMRALKFLGKILTVQAETRAKAAQEHSYGIFRLLSHIRIASPDEDSMDCDLTDAILDAVLPAAKELSRKDDKEEIGGLKALSKLLSWDECPEATFSLASKVAKELTSSEPLRAKLLLEDLVMGTEALGAEVTTELRAIIERLRKGGSAEDEPVKTCELRLLRVVKTIKILRGTSIFPLHLEETWSVLSEALNVMGERIVAAGKEAAATAEQAARAPTEASQTLGSSEQSPVPTGAGRASSAAGNRTGGRSEEEVVAAALFAQMERFTNRQQHQRFSPSRIFPFSREETSTSRVGTATTTNASASSSRSHAWGDEDAEGAARIGRVGQTSISEENQQQLQEEEGDDGAGEEHGSSSRQFEYLHDRLIRAVQQHQERLEQEEEEAGGGDGSGHVDDEEDEEAEHAMDVVGDNRHVLRVPRFLYDVFNEHHGHDDGDDDEDNNNDDDDDDGQEHHRHVRMEDIEDEHDEDDDGDGDEDHDDDDEDDEEGVMHDDDEDEEDEDGGEEDDNDDDEEEDEDDEDGEDEEDEDDQEEDMDEGEMHLVHTISNLLGTHGGTGVSRHHQRMGHLAKVNVPGLARFLTIIEAFFDANEDETVVEKFGMEHALVLNTLVRSSPSVLTGSLNALVTRQGCRKVLTFDNKRSYFRSGVKQLHRPAHGLRLSLRRDHIFEDSVAQLASKTPEEMRGHISVAFRGEEGIDAGGVTREWFLILIREMFKPGYALFKQSADSTAFQPDPRSYVNPEHLSLFKFVGRIIGKALTDGHLVAAHFTRSFYKHVLGREVTLNDLQSLDPQYHKSLMSLLEMSDVSSLDLVFTTDVEEFGVRSTIELIPNGAKIPVTEENKHEWVKLSAQQKMTNAIKAQINSFLTGFYEIVPKELIQIFNPQELELLISGMPKIDLDDLAKNTEYNGGFSRDSPQIDWFWKILKSLNQEDRARFLMFVTGTSMVPLEGFANLVGMRGIQRFSIHRGPTSDETLPTAHTCFNQLDLPVYSNEEIMKQKLMLALKEGSEGFGFA